VQGFHLTLNSTPLKTYRSDIEHTSLWHRTHIARTSDTHRSDIGHTSFWHRTHSNFVWTILVL